MGRVFGPAALYAEVIKTRGHDCVVGVDRRTVVGAVWRFDDTLDAHLELLRCYYNFVRPHGALKFGRETRTPVTQAGLATRRLTLRNNFVPLRCVVR